MSILKRRRKKTLSAKAVAHLFSIMGDDDRHDINRFLKKKVKGILPRTKKQMAELPRHRLVQKVLTEEALDQNEEINYHRGGSLVDAAHALWGVGKNALGHLFNHVDAHENNRKLTELETDMAQLVNAAYETEHPAQVDGWTLLPKYTTNYTAVYQNGEGDVCVSVRGTQLKAKDLALDGKILAANVADDAGVDRVFKQIAQDFPQAKKYTAAHSLGTTLVKHALTNMDGGDQFSPYLFNCGSSPLLNVGEWKKFLEQYNPMIFANKGDIVNAGLLESLPEGYTNIVYSPEVSTLIWKNHSLNQWLPEADQPTEEATPEPTQTQTEEPPPGGLLAQYTGRATPDPPTTQTKPAPLHHFDDYDLFGDYVWED